MARVAETAEYLHHLLERPGVYRSAWARRAERRVAAGINQAAVAQVLAEYLWDSGEVDEHDIHLPRRLKDQVSRAFAGKVLPARVLRLFIDAFDITDTDAQALWSRLLGNAGGALSIVRPNAERAPQPPSRGYQVIMLHDFHRVGADHVPVEHRTLQGIRATERLERYRFAFDTSAAAVEVIHGGVASPVYRTEHTGLYAVDILLRHPLEPGETASLEYRTVFAYPEPPEPIMRRVALRRMNNVEINVQFDPHAHPGHVSWCVWEDQFADEPLSTTPVALDEDGRVHRFLEVLEGYGAGFAWEW